MKHEITTFLLVIAVMFYGCKAYKDATIENTFQENDYGSMQPVSLEKKYQQPPYQQIPFDKDLLKDTLENGLTYYIYKYDKNDFKGKAYFQLIQKTGSLVEDEKCSGTAHFVEHTVFNGTKNFPENAAVEYMRRIGVPFGNDVNATTSFEYTEYHLEQVPATNAANIDTCLMILRDWAAYCDFNEQSFPREKNVVLEEYRMRTSYSGYNKFFEFTKGTQYGKRPPLGTEETIKQMTINDLRDYYYKWYQPQNQAIVVYGDIDKKIIEAKIKEIFSPLKRGNSVSTVIDYNPQKHAEPNVINVTDKENPKAVVELIFSVPTDNIPKDKNSTAWYIENDLRKKIAETIQKRLNRIQTENLVFDFTNVYFNPFGCKIDENTPLIITVGTSEANWKKALSAVAGELEKIRRYAWTKQEAYKSLFGDRPDEQLKPMTDSINFSGQFFSNIKSGLEDIFNNFLYGKYLRNGLVSDRLTNYEYSRISGGMVHDYFCGFDKDENLTIALTLPQGGVNKEEVIEIYRKARAEVNENDKYKFAEDPNYQRLMRELTVEVNGGKTVNKRSLDIRNCTEFKLENGVTVVVSNEKAYRYTLEIRGLRRGMMTYFNDEDAKKIALLPQMISSKFHGMTTAKWKSSQHFGDFYDEYYCLSIPLCLKAETWLKYLHYMLTNTKLDTLRFNACKQNLLNSLKTASDEENSLKDKWKKAVYHDEYSERTAPLTAQQIENMTFEEMSELSKKYMSNYNGSVFLIQSNYTPSQLQPLIEKYLGSLPSEKEPVKFQNINAFKFKHNNDSTFYSYKFETPTAGITLSYIWDDFKYDEKTHVYLDAFKNILNELMHKNIRLVDGSVYSIYGNYGFITHFVNAVNFDISAVCAPKNAQAILNRVKTLITKMSEGGVITNQHVENYIKSRLKNSVKKPKYYESLSILFDSYKNGGVDHRIKSEKYIRTLTVEKLQDFIKEFLEKSFRHEIVVKWE